MAGFFQHLLSLPYRFFQQRSSGDLLMRLGSNSAVREALASHTTSALLDGVLVIIFLIALARVSPSIALAACVIALVQITVLLATARRLHCLVQSDIVAQSESQSCLIESLAGIETLKASGAERATFTRWSVLLEKQLDTSMQRGRYMAKLEAAITTLRTFTPLFLLGLGGAAVVNGGMTLGTMLATNALAAAFLQPVASLVMSAQRLQTAGAHLERIADVMRAQPEQGSQIVSPVFTSQRQNQSPQCVVPVRLTFVQRPGEYFLRHLSRAEGGAGGTNRFRQEYAGSAFAGTLHADGRRDFLRRRAGASNEPADASELLGNRNAGRGVVQFIGARQYYVPRHVLAGGRRGASRRNCRDPF